MTRRCAALVLAAIFAAGCHSAGDPTPLCYSTPPEGTYVSTLNRVTGSGQCDTGGTSLTTFAAPHGNFAAILRFQVHLAKPNTTYRVERAAEYDGAPVSADGLCQRADGNWTPSDGSTISSSFVSFPLGGSAWSPPPGPLGVMTLVTDASGSGRTEFEFQTGPGLPRGRKFDVRMRLIDNVAAPTSELRSGCMTVTVQ